MVATSNCLISELAKLKESSKEAVENIDSFNDFKKYMHIKRKSEEELTNIIRNILDSSKPQLVLVCGSVGDGKSHLLSYLKEMIPEINQSFYIHNDATESNAPTMTSMDTLNDVLSGFSDKALENGLQNNQRHILLAINLGTLNNFLHSEYEDNFTRLKEYVISKRILESVVEDNSYEPDSYFQFVNLSDYHLFSLTEKGPTSQFIYDMLDKISSSSDKNPFNKVYLEQCSQTCAIRENCPVKYNYELIKMDKVKDAIISFISELSLKYKTIISSRSLLNFIYNMLVESELGQISSEQDLKKHIEKMSFEQFFSSLLPNLFFDFSQLSEVFSNLTLIDPINKRSETLDSVIITFYNSRMTLSLFEENVSDKLLRHNRVQRDLDIIEQKYKKTALKTLLRFYAFYPNENSKLDFHDSNYTSFSRNLYYWNKGSRGQLKDLYRNVIHSIYEWNGRSEAGRINLYPGRNQLKYTISQLLEIKPEVKDLTERNEENLSKFLSYFVLKFKVLTADEIFSIRVDYPLYELLMKINEGYRPNKQDKNNFVNFDDFINNIIRFGDQEDKLQFIEKVGSRLKKYELSYDEEFETFEFKEI
ncbi:DNA phosphorothioation-dependent restriction protein DptF [Halalkalibacter urbisdiaboli]|uniref:DNA phosphorothioation-dependent restriction protein DptF n=1 Tax=Halalkalibacter urbisdiaboli TaxID=1960589 RepID=UPI000B44B218|nr:DNA phosphorothioation-dependent restriction protein DptF [Halalkalibacter urbisdiaboli]